MLTNPESLEAEWQENQRKLRIIQNQENAARVVLSRIMDATGAKDEFEALQASRALATAMNEIMIITGAPDTKAAVEVVKDLVLVVRESAARKAERDETPHVGWTIPQLMKWFPRGGVVNA
jgi:flagellar biosynthesis regulator FlbT